MTHQTGIEPSDGLISLIAKALHGDLRLLQVGIENEQLVAGEVKPPNGSWEDDYDAFILPCLEDKKACYVLYRLDERNAHEKHLWIFLTYTPDEAPVREKMLYSATKATMKRSFSSAVLVHDISANSRDEMTLAGYRKHVESVNAPPPLTREEEEWKEIEENQDHVDIGTTTRQSHLQGVAFPLQDDAAAAIQDLKRKKIQYLQLSIDLTREEIVLEDAEDSLDANAIASHISSTKPGYHLYLFKHTHEGDYLESFVFIYSCPGYKCSVKERMIYSSCKNPLVSALSDEGIEIKKSIEIDGSDEVNEKFLMDELHPVKQAYRAQFAKPKPPGRKK